MSAMPDSTFADPKDHLIADLQRQLAASNAERDEALEQQTATAEVLQVINSSPGDLAPVFDAILERMHRLCAVEYGALQLYEHDEFRAVATRGYPEPVAQLLRRPYGLEDDNPLRLLLDGASLIEMPDLGREQLQIPNPRTEAAIAAGVRSLLFLPLRKDKFLLGMVSAGRTEPRPFSDKEIALLQNFAAQAVIAMENARLLNELRNRTRDLQESLEYQTAITDVLKVISRSTFNLLPVLESVAQTALQLCESEIVFILRREGEIHRIAAAVGTTPEATAAVARYREFLESYRFTASRNTLTGRVMLAGRPVQIADITADPEYTLTEAATLAKVRTQLGVPLMREGSQIGVMILSRQRVELYSHKQIELVTTFADQAVIAIENARLLAETREALEQQTATAEVLQVINSSPGALAPVFDAMLEKAMRLCAAAFGGLWIADGDHFNAMALRGVPAMFAEFHNKPLAPVLGTGAYLLIEGQRYVHITDIAEDEGYRAGNPAKRSLHDLGGARTALFVSLRQEQRLLGFFLIYRQEVRPFSEREIGLLENFGAQAVVAIENARLLNEIRQHQAELRVTFDSMADGVAMFDHDLRLTAWNRNFQHMLDLPDAVLTARPSYADYLRTLAERGEFGTDDVEAELNRRLDSIDRELRLERTRPDGRVLEVRRNAVPDGGFVLIYSDITERKRSEAEIRAARDAAEAAYRDLKTVQASLIQAEKMASLGQLTAGIAHEIKNPLNFVNNFAGLSIELLDELKESAAPGIATLDERTRADIDETIAMLTGNLDKIAEHGKRADNIVKSMLEHSRGVSGERREVDLNALTDEALNLAYHGARAQDQSFNITLERDFESGLAPIEVAPQEMTRVFLNLFNNGFYAAYKRQREGKAPHFKPTLAVATRETGDAVEIRIRDNGTGILPEIRDRLFQPFFTTKPTGEGTGLGLSISYDIITQQHGGTITVDSEPGAYTEFTLRLPRRVAAGGAA